MINTTIHESTPLFKISFWTKKNYENVVLKRTDGASTALNMANYVFTSGSRNVQRRSVSHMTALSGMTSCSRSRMLSIVLCAETLPTASNSADEDVCGLVDENITQGLDVVEVWTSSWPGDGPNSINDLPDYKGKEETDNRPTRPLPTFAEEGLHDPVRWIGERCDTTKTQESSNPHGEPEGHPKMVSRVKDRDGQEDSTYGTSWLLAPQRRQSDKVDLPIL